MSTLIAYIRRRAALVSSCAVVSACFGIGAACSPDSPLPLTLIPSTQNCDNSPLTYQSFAAKFFNDYCLRCHSVTLVDDWSRTDAPQGINFNTLKMATEFKNRIRLRSGILGDMPPRLLPGPQPTEAERLKLIRWIDCGMPSDDSQAGG